MSHDTPEPNLPVAEAKEFHRLPTPKTDPQWFDHDAIERVRKAAFELNPAEQFRLAFFIAENCGMVLVNEPEHPDSPHATPIPDTSAGEREMVQQSIATKQSTDATAASGVSEALVSACVRLQMFLDTFGDVGDCVTQADINDWIDISSTAVAETRRTAPDDAGLVSGVSADPPSSAGERMREALADFATSAAFASRGALDSDTVFCEIYTPGYQPQKKGSFGFYVKDLRNLLALAALALQGPSGKTPGAVDE